MYISEHVLTTYTVRTSRSIGNFWQGSFKNAHGHKKADNKYIDPTNMHTSFSMW